jgi:hypothetical protein
MSYGRRSAGSGGVQINATDWQFLSLVEVTEGGAW